MELRGLLRRLPLAGVAVAGAVAGHTLAYALASPDPGARVALLAATGHAYWTAAIAAAAVLGLVSLVATLAGHVRDGLAARPVRAADPGVGRLTGRLAGLQIGIYLVQEVLERAAAGLPAGAWVDGRLLGLGVLVQALVAVALAALLAWAGRAVEAAARALRRRPPRPAPAAPRPHPVSFARPGRLLAAGLGGRAPPPG